MKLSEFEEKLKTVSDEKLRQMLASTRRDGPEVAQQLIESEGRRRGLSDFGEAAVDGSATDHSTFSPITLPEEKKSSTDETEAPAMLSQAEGGITSSPNSAFAAGEASAENSADAAGEGTVPPAPAWLTDETSKAKINPMIKVALYIGVLAGLIGAAFKFLRH